MSPHQEALEPPLADTGRDLFGATFDALLDERTSAYFEGEADEVDQARRGSSRDHRPDCLQVVLAVVVTPEGLPLSYEALPGNMGDEGAREAAREVIERQPGKARRIWGFDRGVASEAKLQKLRESGAQYGVGAPRSRLKPYEQALLNGTGQESSKAVQAQLLGEGHETFVLARSAERAKKEEARRWRQVRGRMRELVRLR
jgi:transposase